MDNTNRFNGRGKKYNEFRPDYPEKMFEQISKTVNLEKENTIADIGTGTGKSAHWFLKRGYTVWGVEPSDMIETEVKLRDIYPHFYLEQNTAENTGLGKNSVDLIISGQAIQYFDIAKTKIEFNRVLKSDGWVAIFWNSEMPENKFEKEYYDLIRQFRINDKGFDIRTTRVQRIADLFGAYQYQELSFDYKQHLDKDGLIGRAFSLSHLPKEHTKEGKRLVAELEAFVGNRNEFILNYKTSLFLGKWK